jgi:hypothetical protein
MFRAFSCHVYLISEKVGLLVAHFDVHNLENIKTVRVIGCLPYKIKEQFLRQRTVLRDRLQKCRQKLTDLGLDKCCDWFFEFFGGTSIVS